MKRPRNIRIFRQDKEPDSYPYSVLYIDKPFLPNDHESRFWGISLASWGGFLDNMVSPIGAHLGRRITWIDLPDKCKQAVIRDKAAKP